MRGLGFLLATLALVGAASVSTGACNEQGTCPAKADIKPGASCSGDQLQCPYDNPPGTSDCDRTSCTCTKGSWVCPDPFTCGDAGAPADDGSTPADGEAADTSVDGAPSEAAPAETGAGDAPSEAAPTDTGADAPVDSGGGG